MSSPKKAIESDEDQMQAGLMVVLALALECVLEGLVSEAPLRAWVFHVIVVVLAGWSLFDQNPWVVRSASAAGVVAVGNEAILISDAGASMKFLIPSALLFGASAWVFQRSIATAVAPDAYSNQVIDPLLSTSSPVYDSPSSPMNSSLRKASPFVIGIGAIASLFGLFGASWVQAETLFGLLQNQLTLSEVRASWVELGAPSGIAEFAGSGVPILSILAIIVSAVGAVGAVSQQFVIPRQLVIGGVLVIGFALALQTLTILGLSSAEGNVRVLAGAWIAPLGLATSGVGYYLSSEN